MSRVTSRSPVTRFAESIPKTIIRFSGLPHDPASDREVIVFSWLILQSEKEFDQRSSNSGEIVFALSGPQVPAAPGSCYSFRKGASSCS